jgi:hypothetical protein
MALQITLKNLNAKINKLPKNNIILKVGFLDNEMAKIAKMNEYGGIYPVSNEYKLRAKKANINLGDTINIIPRPFMQTTINENKNKWRKMLDFLLIRNQPFNSLYKLSKIIENDIKNTIKNNDFERNPQHIAQIKGNNKPLIDTGKMYNSIESVIKQ